MTERFRRSPLAAVLAGLLATSCGGTETTSPSSVTAEERVSGVWIGKAHQTAVHGAAERGLRIS